MIIITRIICNAGYFYMHHSEVYKVRETERKKEEVRERESVRVANILPADFHF